MKKSSTASTKSKKPSAKSKRETDDEFIERLVKLITNGPRRKAPKTKGA